VVYIEQSAAHMGRRQTFAGKQREHKAGMLDIVSRQKSEDTVRPPFRTVKSDHTRHEPWRPRSVAAAVHPGSVRIPPIA